MVVALIVMAGGYVWLRSWLHGEEFRTMLSAQAGKGMKAEAEFGAFRWDGTVVDCPSFHAKGSGVMREVDARGLSIDIGLGRVGDRVVELRNARVNQIDLHFDLRGDSVEAPVLTEEEVEPSVPVAPAGAPPWYEKFVPNRVELTGLEVSQSAVTLELDQGPMVFAGTSWDVKPDQVHGSYRASGVGGVITLPWEFLPPLQLETAKLRYQDGTVFLTDADFQVYERGDLRLAGEASIAGGGFSFDGRLRDVMANEVLPPDWSQKVEGRITSDFTVADRGEGVVVDGHLDFADGVLTGLPILDSLGAYGGNPRFRRLSLSEASLDYAWEDGRLVLRDIRIGAEGLIRVEGRLVVEKDESIDGRFRIGLTPGTLARIPGAETKVFLPGERGLLWTDLHITGTLDDPEEDLTNRLIAAAGMRMFEILPETGEKVLRFTKKAMSGEVADLIGGEEGLIKQGTSLIDQGKGLLDGEGSPLDEAEGVLRQADEVVRGVNGLLDIFKDDPEPTVPPEPQPDGDVDDPLDPFETEPVEPN